MSMRRFVLWLTGRDLLKPVLKNTPNVLLVGNGFEVNWVMVIGTLTVHLRSGPNALHRLLQRVVLGIHWRMK